MVEGKTNKVKKLNSNIYKIIFAKSLFGMSREGEERLVRAMATVVVNRIDFESDIDEQNFNVVNVLTDTELFPCWKNIKFMETIDFSLEWFKKCLCIVNDVIAGKNKNLKLQNLISFHKVDRRPFGFIGLCPCLMINDYAFYDVYV